MKHGIAIKLNFTKDYLSYMWASAMALKIGTSGNMHEILVNDFLLIKQCQGSWMLLDLLPHLTNVWWIWGGKGETDGNFLVLKESWQGLM